MQIAYGFEKPVIVTNVGGLPDGKTRYVLEPKKPEALSNAIVDFYRNERGQEFQDNVRSEAYRFSWERLLVTIEKLMSNELRRENE